MKFLLPGLFALFISVFANAQSLSVELAAGPTMAYRIMTTEKQFSGFGDSERPILSYDIGLRLFYPVAEKWRIGAGVFYSRKGLDLGPFYITDEEAEVTHKIKESPWTFSFLEIPIIARYYFEENEQYQIYWQTGVSACVFLQEGLILPTDPSGRDGGSKFVKTENSKAVPFNVGLKGGAGILFPLAGGWRVGAEPVINIQLFPLFSNVPAKRRLFTFGANLIVNRGW